MLNDAQISVMTQDRNTRIFYYKDSGNVLGTGTGGGAIKEFRGDALVYATFTLADDVDAASVIGVVEVYFNPLHSRKPISVNLAKVDAWKAACDAFLDDQGTASALCKLQDGAVSYEAIGD